MTVDYQNRYATTHNIETIKLASALYIVNPELAISLMKIIFDLTEKEFNVLRKNPKILTQKDPSIKLTLTHSLSN